MQGSTPVLFKNKAYVERDEPELETMSDEESYEYEYDDDDMDEEGFQYTDEEEEANDGEVALGEFENSDWKSIFFLRRVVLDIDLLLTAIQRNDLTETSLFPNELL